MTSSNRVTLATTCATFLVVAASSALAETTIHIDASEAGSGMAIGITSGAFADAGLRAGAQQPSLLAPLGESTRAAVDAILAKTKRDGRYFGSSGTNAALGLGILAEKALVGAAAVGIANPGALLDTDYLLTLDHCRAALAKL